jgi:1-deoxy-D-xylulose-5-phosphate reductoisomerase
LRAGGSAPAVLNAANEVAVAAFLGSQLSFDRIPALIEYTLGAVATAPLRAIADVFAADASARECAQSWLARHAVGAGHRPLRVPA